MLAALLLLAAGCSLTLASPHGENVRLGTAVNQGNVQPAQVLGNLLGEPTVASPVTSKWEHWWSKFSGTGRRSEHKNVTQSTTEAAPQTEDIVNDIVDSENVGHIRTRRLADDKKLDLKMKMQRVKKVVSMDAIGSYSLYRSPDRRTSLKAFGSTELWYDGKGFGLKKPGLGVQFTIYY